MFEKINIDTDADVFDKLYKSTVFEDIGKGRKGAIIVDCVDDLIPIIRTTTKYQNPCQKFLPIHRLIIDKIQEKTTKNVAFNNAMIEIYDQSYRTMKFHSDQALDLSDDSYICLFSCYEQSSEKNLRSLNIKNKETSECSEIVLENGSVVLFSKATNHKFLHQIVLKSALVSANRWLGITFRLSKTFVKIVDNVPYIYPTTTVLRMADEQEQNEFYKHKSKENLCTEYTYPQITYSISKSDLLDVA